jgi:hypothetical protein
MSSFSLESVYKSIIRRIELIRQEMMAQGVSDAMEYYAWDSRGDTTELPNHDLIGLIGWSFTENEGLPVVQAGILVSMVMDMNQFREVKAMDIIRNAFVGPNGDYKTIPLVDPTTGIEIDLMQISDFEIMPAGRSEIRSTRNIGLELIRVSNG